MAEDMADMAADMADTRPIHPLMANLRLCFRQRRGVGGGTEVMDSWGICEGVAIGSVEIAMGLSVSSREKETM